jgi:proline dehydrogenase
MPYYRILIWTKKRQRPFAGIRFLESHNINAVQLMVYRKAEGIYHSNLVDVEVQMLSKRCAAVRQYLQKKQT